MTMITAECRVLIVGGFGKEKQIYLALLPPLLFSPRASRSISFKVVVVVLLLLVVVVLVTFCKSLKKRKYKLKFGRWRIEKCSKTGNLTLSLRNLINTAIST